MFRVAYISDTHLASEDPKSLSLFPREIRRREDPHALYQFVRSVIERSYETVYEWLAANGPWDVIIHLGDETSGWREAGNDHPTVRPIAERIRRDLAAIARHVYFCVGNHSVGYGQSIRGNITGGGMNFDSLYVCHEVLGPLYWMHDFGEGPLFVGVCSSLAEYDGDDGRIRHFVSEQERLLRRVFSTYRGRPWVLHAHAPSTPGNLAHIITPHLGELQHFVFGDWHAPWSGRMRTGLARAFNSSLLRSLFSRKARVNNYALARGVLCPSTAPVWWPGAGCTVLECDGDKLNFQHHWHAPSEGYHVLPSSFLRGLWWMRWWFGKTE